MSGTCTFVAFQDVTTPRYFMNAVIKTKAQIPKLDSTTGIETLERSVYCGEFGLVQPTGLSALAVVLEKV